MAEQVIRYKEEYAIISPKLKQTICELSVMDDGTYCGRIFGPYSEKSGQIMFRSISDIEHVIDAGRNMLTLLDSLGIGDDDQPAVEPSVEDEQCSDSPLPDVPPIPDDDQPNAGGEEVDP